MVARALKWWRSSAGAVLQTKEQNWAVHEEGQCRDRRVLPGRAEGPQHCDTCLKPDVPLDTKLGVKEHPGRT